MAYVLEQLDLTHLLREVRRCLSPAVHDLAGQLQPCKEVLSQMKRTVLAGANLAVGDLIKATEILPELSA